MHLSLFHDSPSSEPYAARFRKERVLERLRELDDRICRHGLGSLDPKKDLLVAIGCELDPQGKVTKCAYGMFQLSWRAKQHPEWADRITSEVQEIQNAVKKVHGTPLRFLIWVGMGGSAEDKSMYNAVGLLRRGVRCYVLDSTDPAKLKYILEDIRRRYGLTTPEVLRGTLVAAMALGMTSYEPVVNLERLAALYEKYKIDSSPNFIYMALPDSLLDQFARSRGFKRVELQLDGQYSTTGRHSAPLTRGSLYPLALSRVDLRQWIQGTWLSDEEIDSAWRLAAFFHVQGMEGRDKVTLLLPKEWDGAGIWTKQNFEESLGKSEVYGIKIVLESKHKLANYRSPRDPNLQRTFFAVQMQGGDRETAKKINLLRRSSYPLAALTLPPETPLSRYMQFIHYTVTGLAYLREVNFVTQPNVELYKSIANDLYIESRKVGGIAKTKAWQAMGTSAHQIVWEGSITLNYGLLRPHLLRAPLEAPELYAQLVRKLTAAREIEYAELTFFGDTRYSPAGKRLRRVLEHAAERVFRGPLKMPVDVYEGPAMNHSYHEMIIGHGKCFSTILISDKQESFSAAGPDADYHRAQFLATQMALQQRGRLVVTLTLKDLEDSTLDKLGRFFLRAASHLKNRRC